MTNKAPTGPAGSLDWPRRAGPGRSVTRFGFFVGGAAYQARANRTKPWMSRLGRSPAIGCHVLPPSRRAVKTSCPAMTIAGPDCDLASAAHESIESGGPGLDHVSQPCAHGNERDGDRSVGR